MALNEQQKQRAKYKAVSFLEKSIFDLCLVLGVDQDDLTSDYEIPVTEDNPDYKGYFSLVKMFQNLEKIENGL
jgi:hypothetical protein